MTRWSCPIPFEGETLFSIIARFFLRGAFKSAHGVARRLGLSSCRPLVSPLGGGYLSNLTQAFPEFVPVLDLEVAVWRHSTSPLLLAFSKGCNDVGRRSEFTKVAIKRGGWASAPHSSALLVPDGMRFCTECCESDIRNVGVPYWHREHQVKIVTHCWRHGDRLKEFVPGIGRGHKLDVPAFETYGEDAIEVSIPDPMRDGLGVRVANAVAHVLNAPEWSEPELVREIFLQACDHLGLLHRRHGAMEKIWHFMLENYGGDFFAALGLPVSYTQGVVKRFMTPIRAGNERLDPGVIILMACALGLDNQHLCGVPVATESTNSSRTIGLPRVVSDRIGDDEELRSVLVKSDYILGRAKDALGISRHQLIKRIVEAGIQCPIVQGGNAKLSETEIREMIELVRIGAPREQIMKRFSCKSSLIDQVFIYDSSLREDAKKARHEVIRMENRDAVIACIKSNKGMARVSLREMLPGPMSFLERNDKAWLDSIWKDIPRQMRGVRVASAGRARVDDDEFDKQVVEKLRTVKERGRALIPPRRVTSTLAFRMAGISLSTFVRLGAGRMPRTEVFLQEIAESESEYVTRKLKYAFQKLTANRSTVTAKSLRLASGFPERKLEEYRDLVHQLAEEAGMPFSSRTARWLI